MVVEVPVLFNSLDILGILLTFFALIYAVKIGRTVGWFAAWRIIVTALALIVVWRALAAYATFAGSPPWFIYIGSIIQLLLSTLFILGFGLLYQTFRRSHRRR
jgi:hypothetical protein